MLTSSKNLNSEEPNSEVQSCYESVLSEINFQSLHEECTYLETNTFHRVGGVFSQLRLLGWLQELQALGEWDVDLHFLLDGVMHGFHVVDPDNTISPNFCDNYRNLWCK